MTHTTDDVTAGTKAMYESSLLLPELFDEPVWEKLDDPDRNDLCKAFAAGQAAMPDQSAELLEALERVEKEIRLCAYTGAGDPKRADDVKMFVIWAGSLQKLIAIARAQKVGAGG